MVDFKKKTKTKAPLFGGYKKRTTEDLKKHKASLESGRFDQPISGDHEMFVPADGSNRVRILPATWEGSSHWGHIIFIHYGVGPDNQRYLCRKQMFKGPCPLCEIRSRERLLPEGKKDEALIKDLNATKRIGVWVIDRKREEDGPLLWLMPIKIDGALVDICTGGDVDTGEALDLEHPEEGYDVIFNKTGKGMGTDYTGMQVARRSSPISEDPDTLTELSNFVKENPIPGLMNFYSYKRIHDQVAGEVPAEDDSSEEVEEEEETDEEDFYGEDPEGGEEDEGADESGESEDSSEEEEEEEQEEEVQSRRPPSKEKGSAGMKSRLASLGKKR